MDDHHPAGIHHPGKPTIFHPAPSPFGIAYRCLFSRNIANLFCAGRNISVSHAALSSTRVMATCAVIGQAVGSAAALASSLGVQPRMLYPDAIGQLQQMLLADDCYLPGIRREIPVISRQAELSSAHGEPELLRNGVDRRLPGQDNCWSGPVGTAITYSFAEPVSLRQARLVFDSCLERADKNQPSNRALKMSAVGVPVEMIRGFRLEIPGSAGQWDVIARVSDNHQRLVCIPLTATTTAIRFVPETTWGASTATVFAWDVS